MNYHKKLLKISAILSLVSLTGCQTVYEAYKSVYHHTSKLKQKHTLKCSDREVGQIYSNGLGFNNYTLVVDDKSIRSGNVMNLLKENMKFSYENKRITRICTSHVTNMSNLFENTPVKLAANITNFDTSNVTDMSYMFSKAREFNQPIGDWDTSKVTNMSHMFYRARAFNQPLNKWNTSKVKNMEYMFSGTFNFNQPINNWNVFNVRKDSHFVSATSKLKPEYSPNFLVFTFAVNLTNKNIPEKT
jgi:surface protein